MKYYLLVLLFIPFFFGQAFAINATSLNQTLSSLEPELETTNQLNIFFPIFLLVAEMFFMMYALKNRHDGDKLGLLFAIAAMVVAIVLTFIFNSNYDFVFTVEKTTITIEEIEWLGTNETTQNANIVKDVSNAKLISSDGQMRFVFTALFSVLIIFNGLLAILTLTHYGPKNMR